MPNLKLKLLSLLFFIGLPAHALSALKVGGTLDYSELGCFGPEHCGLIFSFSTLTVTAVNLHAVWENKPAIHIEAVTSGFGDTCLLPGFDKSLDCFVPFKATMAIDVEAAAPQSDVDEYYYGDERHARQGGLISMKRARSRESEGLGCTSGYVAGDDRIEELHCETGDHFANSNTGFTVYLAR